MRMHLLLIVGLGAAAYALPAAADPGKPVSASELSARIDRHIQAAWKANGVQPAAPATDAEFLRRVYLDLAGHIPRVHEVRAFLDDRQANKRERLVEKLLAEAGYVQHFSTVWRREWLPQTLSNPQLQFFGGQFEIWMRKQLTANAGYGQIVRDLVTVPPNGLGPRGVFDQNDPPPIAFLQVNELRPENIAAATSRLFLGVKLECAQCHDHPFETYKREQFWEFASFFAGLQPTNPRFNRAPIEAIEVRSLMIPGTEKKVAARFLDRGAPAFKEKISSRITLAEWMTAKDNPYFARNAANRMWAYFFGIGLIDPIDEPSDKNPPSHPELLDDLARSFAASGYDLKFLIRAIVNSKTYQLSSAAPGASAADSRTFGRMKVRGLLPEQFFDSLVLATGYREQRQRGEFATPGSPRALFLARFSTTERLSEVQTSILQALTLMNGKMVGDMTSVEQSETLAGIIDAPFMDRAQRIETLFLAALARRPSPAELQKLGAYVEKGGTAGDSNKALADVFWALLNSSEFGFNH
jgi:hypothetical protein